MPALTLTVSVAGNAPSSVTNTATVSYNMPETNPANNTANDPTTIIQTTSTALTASAGTVTYGTSQTFTATVTSGGSAVTGGTVTFTDTTTAVTLASNVALNGSGQAATSVVLAAGSHNIQATYNPDAGHAGSSNNTGVTVNKAALTVTGDPKTIAYPAAAPAFTATITGFVNADTPAVVSGAASLSSNATTTNGNPNAGAWTITPAVGTLAASNYTFKP